MSVIPPKTELQKAVEHVFDADRAIRATGKELDRNTAGKLGYLLDTELWVRQYLSDTSPDAAKALLKEVRDTNNYSTNELKEAIDNLLIMIDSVPYKPKSSGGRRHRRATKKRRATKRRTHRSRRH